MSCLLSCFKHVHSPGLSFISKLYNQSHITRLIARESIFFHNFFGLQGVQSKIQIPTLDTTAANVGTLVSTWKVPAGCSRTAKLPSEKLASKKAPQKKNAARTNAISKTNVISRLQDENKTSFLLP